MSDMTNDPPRSITANLALSKLARNQAMIDQALRPSFRDSSFRKITARTAVTNRTPLIDTVAKSITQTRIAPGVAALAKAQTGGLAAQMVGARIAPGVAALAKAQTGGLAAQMVGARIAPGIAALTKAQTGGLAALAGPKVSPGAALTKALTEQLAGPRLAPGSGALTRSRMGGLAAELAKQNSVTSAIEGMRKATEGYAATTHALEPSRRPGNALMDAMKAFDAESRVVEVYDRDAIKPLPPVRNFTADLVRLQHEAAELRELERREEGDHRRQSLAVQLAMRDALIASEEARAADAEASAKREMAALDRAIAAENRAQASDEREAKMLRLTMVTVTIGGVSLLVAIAAVIVTIIVAG